MPFDPTTPKSVSVAEVCNTETEEFQSSLSLARRDYEQSPGLIINPTHMAWRPYENLMDGELDNRTQGRVTGWIRFHRSGKRPLKVKLDLTGDFHDDIRGKVIRLSNPTPLDRSDTLERDGTYMEGFASVQQGTAGDITAGLSLGIWTDDLAQRILKDQDQYWEEKGVSARERKRGRKEAAEGFRKLIRKHEPYYPYVPYPYIEWYSEANGRVVLELEPSQVEIVGSGAQPKDQVAEAPQFRELMTMDTVEQALKGAGFERLREVGIPPSAMANQ